MRIIFKKLEAMEIFSMKSSVAIYKKIALENIRQNFLYILINYLTPFPIHHKLLNYLLLSLINKEQLKRFQQIKLCIFYFLKIVNIWL